MRRSGRSASLAGLTLAVGLPLAAGLAWRAYSALAVNHRRPLRPALPGGRRELNTAGGIVCLYGSDAEDGVPLLLIHSINAAASAYEMRPLFLHYLGSRPVYAIDLPGYGLSERRDQTYTPRTMTDAIKAALQDIRSRHELAKADVIGLSVSCEYAARAALEEPDSFRSLGLISPTGFDKSLSGHGRAQTTKGNALRLAVISSRIWSQALFDLM